MSCSFSSIYVVCWLPYFPHVYFQAGQISHEEAFLAKQHCMQDKKDMVLKLRSTSQELMEQYFAHKQHEKLEMRRLVEATSAGQQNIREARAKLTKMKQKIGMLHAP